MLARPSTSEINWADSETLTVSNSAVTFTANRYKPVDGTAVVSSTTTSTTSNKLVDSAQSFLTTVRVGYKVNNTTDNTTAYVTAVDNDTTLSLSSDIMTTTETYTIEIRSNQTGRSANFAKCQVITDAIRYYQDGKTPSASLGWYVRPNSTSLLGEFIIEGATNIANFKMIRVTSDATVNIMYGWGIKL